MCVQLEVDMNWTAVENSNTALEVSSKINEQYAKIEPNE